MRNIIKILILTFFLIDTSFAQLSKVQIEIGTKKLIAEIAETDEEQSEGLMNRQVLGKDNGMLFIFEEALEVNKGWFEQNNIKVGDKILSIKRIN
ncbi:MAG: DUF192 domain-containing protein [Candidatus Fonsibacter ubiquis]|nr:DUF192 domain-containing protein [Candidatus Fonsibacter ubiquis]